MCFCTIHLTIITIFPIPRKLDAIWKYQLTFLCVRNVTEFVSRLRIVRVVTSCIAWPCTLNCTVYFATTFCIIVLKHVVERRISNFKIVTDLCESVLLPQKRFLWNDWNSIDVHSHPTKLSHLKWSLAPQEEQEWCRWDTIWMDQNEYKCSGGFSKVGKCSGPILLLFIWMCCTKAFHDPVLFFTFITIIRIFYRFLLWSSQSTVLQSQSSLMCIMFNYELSQYHV